MVETHFELTTEERAFLRELLEQILKETRIEEHRTRAPNYREQVVRREGLIESLLQKLNQPAAT